MFHAETAPKPPAARTSGAAAIAPPPRTLCRGIIACVATDFGLAPVSLIAPTRGSPRAALARQMAMYLAHVDFGLKYDVVGYHFGRDRTTVAHACRVIEDARDDRGLDLRLSTLESACRSAIERLARPPANDAAGTHQ